MDNREIAYFAAGCFWGVEQAFGQMPGVLETEVGYAGGHKVNPTYEDVCNKDTGHAEVVKVVFDPTVVPYKHLVERFFEIHDPTTLNRQGPDIGEQYRSAIFYTTEDQKAVAQSVLEAAKMDFNRPIVTEIEPAGSYYPAEEYHQKYLDKRGMASCHIPKA